MKHGKFCSLILILILFSTDASAADKISPIEHFAHGTTCNSKPDEWVLCNKDSDCAIAPNACGFPQFAAAVAYKDNVAACAKTMIPKEFDCTLPHNNGSKTFTPRCLNHVCRAQPTN